MTFQKNIKKISNYFSINNSNSQTNFDLIDSSISNNNSNYSGECATFNHKQNILPDNPYANKYVKNNPKYIPKNIANNSNYSGEYATLNHKQNILPNSSIEKINFYHNLNISIQNNDDNNGNNNGNNYPDYSSDCATSIHKQNILLDTSLRKINNNDDNNDDNNGDNNGDNSSDCATSIHKQNFLLDTSVRKINNNGDNYDDNSGDCVTSILKQNFLLDSSVRKIKNNGDNNGDNSGYCATSIHKQNILLDTSVKKIKNNDDNYANNNGNNSSDYSGDCATSIYKQNILLDILVKKNDNNDDYYGNNNGNNSSDYSGDCATSIHKQNFLLDTSLRKIKNNKNNNDNNGDNNSNYSGDCATSIHKQNILLDTSLRKIKNNNDLDNIEFIPDYCVYTDGSCKNNGNCFIGGIGVFFSINDSRNLSKKIVSENNNKITNNICEITAILEAYNIIKNDLHNHKKIAIYTDSEYCLKCLNNYGKKLEIKNFSDNIPNKELVKKLYLTFKNLKNIKFFHIRSHTDYNDIHSIGNYNADKLANLAYNDSSPNDNLLLKHIDYNYSDINTPSNIYLNVPFSKKDIAKKYGAKWDNISKKWFILSDNTYKDFLIETFK